MLIEVSWEPFLSVFEFAVLQRLGLVEYAGFIYISKQEYSNCTLVWMEITKHWASIDMTSMEIYLMEMGYSTTAMNYIPLDWLQAGTLPLEVECVVGLSYIGRHWHVPSVLQQVELVSATRRTRTCSKMQ